MKKSSLFRAAAAFAATLVLLAGCGGGDGDSVNPNFIRPTTPLGSSAQYANICTLETQKKFVRSYLDEVYLWYDEIVDVDPEAFTVRDYFNALLVRTPDANGLPKDQFSAIIPAAGADSPTQPTPEVPQQFNPGALLSSHTPFVQQTRVLTTTSGRRVGYIDFRDHERGAQDDLITAFGELRAAGVQDLILDLRLNSGGFLYIAQTAASMVTGPGSAGRVFERLRYNDKRPARTALSTLFFSDRVQFADRTDAGVTQYPVGTALPQLGLPRVFVLTSGATCSSSESIINGLRGIDVQVIQIGTTTCGKPYGFERKDNCGLSLFPIEFEGSNAKGSGGYTAGFAPHCRIPDERPAGVLPGDTTQDPLTVGALFYIENSACPPGSATGLQSAATPRLGSDKEPSRPAWTGRLLLPEQKP